MQIIIKESNIWKKRETRTENGTGKNEEFRVGINK